MTAITWGLNGYDERCYYCGDCHKVMGFVREHEIQHSCDPNEKSDTAILFDADTVTEIQIPVKKLSAAEFDNAIDSASDARASLVSCVGDEEQRRETQWVLRSVLKLQHIALKRRNANRLHWQTRMVMHCCNTVMQRNGWTVLQLTAELRKCRARCFNSGYFDGWAA